MLRDAEDIKPSKSTINFTLRQVYKLIYLHRFPFFSSMLATSANHLIDPNFVSASVTITRECLSTLRAFRTDIPADHYEGCRQSAKDVRLAHYVFNNTIKELDIRRDYFDSTEFCFCFLDHRCNSSNSLIQPLKLILTVVLGSVAVRMLF